MENKEIVKQLVKLQILCMRWVERNTNLKCSTHRDMDRILNSNKLACNYKEAVDNLRINIEKFCRESGYLMQGVYNLQEEINKSEIKNLNFGIRKLTEEEMDLANYKLQRTFFMINEMVGIKYIVETLGLTESQVKQACQQERLLNTKKIGRNWMVHIPECRAYWNIPDKEEGRLYKDWEY